MDTGMFDLLSDTSHLNALDFPVSDEMLASMEDICPGLFSGLGTTSVAPFQHVGPYQTGEFGSTPVDFSRCTPAPAVTSMLAPPPAQPMHNTGFPVGSSDSYPVTSAPGTYSQANGSVINEVTHTGGNVSSSTVNGTDGEGDLLASLLNSSSSDGMPGLPLNFNPNDPETIRLALEMMEGAGLDPAEYGLDDRGGVTLTTALASPAGSQDSFGSGDDSGVGLSPGSLGSSTPRDDDFLSEEVYKQLQVDPDLVHSLIMQNGSLVVDPSKVSPAPVQPEVAAQTVNLTNVGSPVGSVSSPVALELPNPPSPTASQISDEEYQAMANAMEMDQGEEVTLPTHGPKEGSDKKRKSCKKGKKAKATIDFQVVEDAFMPIVQRKMPKMTVAKLVKMPPDSFNTILDKCNLDELSIINMKEWRRRKKNKNAASIARKKKREVLEGLEAGKGDLVEELAKLQERVEKAEQGIAKWKPRALAAEQKAYAEGRALEVYHLMKKENDQEGMSRALNELAKLQGIQL